MPDRSMDQTTDDIEIQAAWMEARSTFGEPFGLASFQGARSEPQP